MRFLLATVVVLAHSFYVLGVKGVHVGTMAVLGFFGISGFLVTQSWLRKPVAVDFFRKRILRIYPAFAAVVLFDYLVVAPLATGRGLRFLARVEPLQVLREIVTLQHMNIPGVFEDHAVRAVNGSLWSIPYEFLCYILLVVFGLLGVVHRRGLLLGITALVWVVYALAPLLVPGVGRTFDVVLPFVLSFLVGAVLFVYRERVVASPARIAIVVGLLIGTMGHRALFAMVWPVGLPYVLLWVSRHPRVPFQGWGRPGDFSYGLYLFAFPIQQLLVDVGGRGTRPLPLFFASMLLTVPVAMLSWFLIERPFLRLKERSAAAPAAEGAA